jgi:hypothetical protein
MPDTDIFNTVAFESLSRKIYPYLLKAVMGNLGSFDGFWQLFPS